MKENYINRDEVSIERVKRGTSSTYIVSNEHINGPFSARLIKSGNTLVGLSQIEKIERPGEEKYVLKCIFMYDKSKGIFELPLVMGRSINHYTIDESAGDVHIRAFSQGKKVADKYKYVKIGEEDEFGKAVSQYQIVLDPKYVKGIAEGLEGTDLELKLFNYLEKIKKPDEELDRKKTEGYINQMAKNPEYQRVFEQFRSYLINNKFMKIDGAGQPAAGTNQSVEEAKKKMKKEAEIRAGTRMPKSNSQKIKALEERIKILSGLKRR